MSAEKSSVVNDVHKTIISDLLADKRELQKVDSSLTVGQILDSLSQRKIFAATFADDNGKPSSVISTFDLVNLVLKDVEAINQPLFKALTGPRQTVNIFQANNTVLEVSEPMSKGVHRSVVELERESFKVITQSDVLRFFLKHEALFPDAARSLESLGLVSRAGALSVQFHKNTTIAEAIKKLSEFDVPIGALVDEEGKFLSALSTAEVRNFSQETLQARLTETIDKYLEEFDVISVTTSMSLGQVARIALDHRLHFLVVTNEERVPVGFVTLSDLINVLRGIDEDLHSRQLAVYGRGAMKRLGATNVLISGINGLGAEVAKNVILAGVRSVTLHDTKVTRAEDLGSNFYLCEADIGKNRALACLKKFRELNPSVKVNASTAELNTDLVQQHSAVVLIEVTTSKAIELDEFARKQDPPISFIKADVFGVAASLFSDFGENFEVNDVNGENPGSFILSTITEDGKIQVVSEESITFGDNSFVRFTEVEGLDELNHIETQVYDVCPYSFRIRHDISATAKSYIRGGKVFEVKKSKTLQFRSYNEALRDPGFFEDTDFSKFGRSATLHLVYQSLFEFAEKENGGHFPDFWNDAHTEKVLHIIKRLNVDGIDFDEEEIKQIVSVSRGVWNPMAASLGGIVGQEVIKSATGKFHPFFQFLYFDAVEVLPASKPHDIEPRNSRYDHQIQMFGWEFQQKVFATNLFLVGAGALGCEFLKNFSICGLGAQDKGSVTVTDDDRIEKSNLSRQFLFRNWHIHKPKSLCAAQSAKEMNPEFTVFDKQERVAPNTEKVFNDEFWNKIDVVVNALDNIKARLYVDTRCIFFEKPLLESGTLGPKCHSQVILPHKTPHYGAEPDPPEKQTPACTLHNFPHNIDHCLQWARSEFVGNFESGPEEVKNYYSSAKFMEELKESGTEMPEIVEKLKTIQEVLKNKPTSFEDCVHWARLKFDEYFYNRIVQLVFNCPENQLNSKGVPFWSPPKRFPTAIDFDPNDEVHLQFIISASNLRANIFGVTVPTDNNSNRNPSFFIPILEKIQFEKFVPFSDSKLKTEAESGGQPQQQQQQQQQQPESYGDEIEKIVSTLPKLGEFSNTLTPEEFEKDNDKNHHMDFVAAVGNLRARNYKIEEVDLLKAKLIAGRIIPAIATATALATGFITIELFKILAGKEVAKDFQSNGDYRNSSCNLALPTIQLFEPLVPQKSIKRSEVRIPDPINNPEYTEEEDIEVYPEEGFTIWDKLRIKVTREHTLGQIIDEIKKTFGLDVEAIAFPDGDKLISLFISFLPSAAEKKARVFTELYSSANLGSLEGVRYILPQMSFSKNFNSCETPTVIFEFV